MSAPTGPVALLFAIMDHDFDRVVLSDEAVVGIDAEWLRVDSGEDQLATAHDIADWAEISLGQAIALPNHMSFDFDLDDEVTENEFKDRMRHEFDKLDKNDDKQLIRSELVLEPPVRPVGRAFGGQDSWGSDRSKGGGGPGGRGGGRTAVAVAVKDQAADSMGLMASLQTF